MTSPGAPDSPSSVATSGPADVSELPDPRPSLGLNAAETPWESMPIPAILELVAKMDGSRAQGDAQAVLVAVGKAARQDAKDLYSVASSKAKERQEVRVVLTCYLVVIC